MKRTVMIDSEWLVNEVQMFLQQGSGYFLERQAEVKSAKSVFKRLLLFGMFLYNSVLGISP